MNTYWWFRPSRVALLIVLPIEWLAFAASNDFYQQFGSHNAITDERFFLVWLSVIGFAGASWCGEILSTKRNDHRSPYMTQGNFQVLMYSLALIATCGAVIFLAPFVAHPGLVASSLEAEPGAAYVAGSDVNQVPGLTSLENLFNLVIVLLMVKPQLTGYRRTGLEKLLLAFILVLTAFKAFIHTERLALIEIMIPLCLLIASSRRRSLGWALAPVVGIGALFLFFAGTEYFRSWVAFYADKSDSLFGFALDRMLAYYATAVNNGAYIYGELNTRFFPVFTGGWLWHLPIPGFADGLSQSVGVNAPDPRWIQTLLAGQNFEFNNTSGVFAPLIDFGPGFGVAVWIGLGYLSGRLYRRFAEGGLAGLILFPTWYVGVLEIARVFYWGDSRYFPTLVVSLAIVCLFLLRRDQGTRAMRAYSNRIRLYRAHLEASGRAG